MGIKKGERPLILVSNDDGIHAKGLNELITVARELGDVVVVAPEKGESGMSHAISISVPLRVKRICNEEGLIMYSTTGTPVDCVKLAINQLLDRKPDIVFSGINHGSNASISTIYSGTMGAAVEACLNGISSAGFSLLNHAADADFSAITPYVKKLAALIVENGLPYGTCLNINFPDVPVEELKGIRVCRMTKGVWKEEYDKRVDPHGKTYYWLTGFFNNFEEDAEDTDERALADNYISVVPISIDVTSYKAIDLLKKQGYEI